MKHLTLAFGMFIHVAVQFKAFVNLLLKDELIPMCGRYNPSIFHVIKKKTKQNKTKNFSVGSLSDIFLFIWEYLSNFNFLLTSCEISFRIRLKALHNERFILIT